MCNVVNISISDNTDTLPKLVLRCFETALDQNFYYVYFYIGAYLQWKRLRGDDEDILMCLNGVNPARYYITLSYKTLS